MISNFFKVTLIALFFCSSSVYAMPFKLFKTNPQIVENQTPRNIDEQLINEIEQKELPDLDPKYWFRKMLDLKKNSFMWMPMSGLVVYAAMAKNDPKLKAAAEKFFQKFK